MSLPYFSAIFLHAQILAPDEVPQRSPVLSPDLWWVFIASSSVTVTTSSIKDVSRTSGIKAVADSLNLMQSRFIAEKSGYIFWFYGTDNEVRVLLFEILADALEGSAAAEAGDKNIHFSIQIFINFRSQWSDNESPGCADSQTAAA